MLLPGGNGGTTTTTVTVAGIMDYAITASSGSGGSISDEGATTLAEGGSKTYTITPKSSDYEISDVLVDGQSVGAVESYTFENVAADHTICVDFGIIGKVEAAGITEEGATVEVLGVTEELPYTGFNWMYYFVGLGALISAGGLILLLKKLRGATV